MRSVDMCAKVLYSLHVNETSRHALVRIMLDLQGSPGCRLCDGKGRAK